jgi:chloramphenicol O-acetyltransferase type A
MRDKVMRKIDIEHWDRKQTYTFFKDFIQPMFSITVSLDVTKLYEKVKREKTSFYLSFMHLAIQEMNKIEAFKCRFVHEEPVIFDVIHPSFTDIIPNSERFKIVTVNYIKNRDQFIIEAKHISDNQGDIFIDLSKEARMDLVYISTFPWASFTQVTHANNPNSKDAVPRLTWGKYQEENGIKRMPLSIEAHHAFVDGYHVGKFIQCLQEALHQEKDSIKSRL